MKDQTIESDPKVMMGKPVVSGTRITVESIVRKINAGESITQLLEEYPRLTKSGVLAALQFANVQAKTVMNPSIPEHETVA